MFIGSVSLRTLNFGVSPLRSALFDFLTIVLTVLIDTFNFSDILFGDSLSNRFIKIIISFNSKDMFLPLFIKLPPIVVQLSYNWGCFVIVRFYRTCAILFIGTFDQIKSLNAAAESSSLGLSLKDGPVNLRDFVLNQHEEDKSKFLYTTITVNATSPLLNKTIKASDLRDNWNCLVIGLERGNYTIVNPNISLVFEKDDLLWVLGKQKMINKLVREEIL